MAGRKGARWRAGVVVAGMLGLAAVVAVLGVMLWVKDLQTASKLAPLVAVMLTALPLAVGLVR